jgi:hypothetical protein
VIVMRAQVGDRLIVKGNKVGAADSVGLILEVRGSGGAPPYLVEWDNREGQHLVWPGTDATVERPKSGRAAS